MHTSMNEPLGVSILARAVWHDFLRARRALLIYEALFKLAEAWLLVPAVALALAAILSSAGHIAVSNRDILDFLITPLGLLYAALFSIIAVAVLLFEQAGVMILAAWRTFPGRPPFGQMLRTAFQNLFRIVQLGSVEAALMARGASPLRSVGRPDLCLLIVEVRYLLLSEGRSASVLARGRHWQRSAGGRPCRRQLALCPVVPGLTHPSIRESGPPSSPARQPRARARRGLARRFHPAWLADRRAVARGCC